MKKWALRAGVVAARVALALLLRGRDRLPETPEAAVAAFYDAAGCGDDAGYLRLVSGPLRTSLEDARSQLGAEAFRESLRRTTSGLKGVATSRGSDAPPGQVVVEVELVFADRIERQRMGLAETGAGWAIQSLTTTSMITPAVPYGTPVFEEPRAKSKPEAKKGRP